MDGLGSRYENNTKRFFLYSPCRAVWLRVNNAFSTAIGPDGTSQRIWDHIFQCRYVILNRYIIIFIARGERETGFLELPKSSHSWLGYIKYPLKSHNTAQEYAKKTAKRAYSNVWKTLCMQIYAPKLNSVPSIIKILTIGHRLWRNGKSNSRDFENRDCTVILIKMKVIFQLEFWD